jgi:hypothetical protein
MTRADGLAAAVPDDERLPHDLLATQVVRLTASLADLVADDVVVEAYRAVAAGRLADAASALAFAVLRAGARVTEAELDVLDECLEELGVRHPALDRLEPAEAGRDLPFHFHTGPGAQESARVDEAVVPLLADLDGVLGAWCAWRYPEGGTVWPPPRPWVVVEARDPATLLTVMTRVHGPDRPVAGPDDPLVEAYLSGHEVSATQLHVQYYGELNHVAVPVPAFAFADLFDGTPGPDLTPAEIQHVPDDEAHRLLARLRAGRLVVNLPEPGLDVVDRGRGSVVPRHLWTDGRWVWSEGTHYYLERYRIAPPRALLHHLRSGPAGPLTDVGVHLVLLWLRRSVPRIADGPL